jgi:hypothetical protein
MVAIDIKRQSVVKMITKYSVEVEKNDLKARLIKNFIDVINDNADEDIEDLRLQVDSFSEALENVSKGDWEKLFSTGYTPMLLDKETMEAVERFFYDKKNKEHAASTELEIVVVDDDWKYYIREINIDY